MSYCLLAKEKILRSLDCIIDQLNFGVKGELKLVQVLAQESIRVLREIFSRIQSPISLQSDINTQYHNIENGLNERLINFPSLQNDFMNLRVLVERISLGGSRRGTRWRELEFHESNIFLKIDYSQMSQDGLSRSNPVHFFELSLHPNIVQEKKVLGGYTAKYYRHDLYRLFYSQVEVSSEMKISFMSQFLWGLNFIHKHGRILEELRLGNCYLENVSKNLETPSWLLKLGDFNCSEKYGRLNIRDQNGDLFAAGIILYEIYHAKIATFHHLIWGDEDIQENLEKDPDYIIFQSKMNPISEMICHFLNPNIHKKMSALDAFLLLNSLSYPSLYF